MRTTRFVIADLIMARLGRAPADVAFCATKNKNMATEYSLTFTFDSCSEWIAGARNTEFCI